MLAINMSVPNLIAARSHALSVASTPLGRFYIITKIDVCSSLA